ncbi:MAG: VWA domain-containing protein [Planctomycetota bacterium]
MSSAGTKALWAWLISIGFHAAVLAVLALADFSQAQDPQAETQTPRAQIIKPAPLPVIPKPKIKQLQPLTPQKTSQTCPPLNIPIPITQTTSQQPCDKTPAKLTSPLISPALPQQPEIITNADFFGIPADERKLCYVVDCSGSMQGIFSVVLENLRQSISTLQPDQYFALILFGGDRLQLYHDGRLIRATGRTVSDAQRFIERSSPHGRTNAMDAVKKALLARDETGCKPDVIYFLTDGFELSEQDSLSFAADVENLRKNLAPNTKINTIGFWTQKNDCALLENIARRSGGQFKFIADD